ncbi:uncharacterized protein LOC119189998 [Manduca sexta]|uniref:uncharacterized protein LOC119189998 n=1 Tax=Manduca sexta TaxID=7130 RepID=UPI00188F9D8E|nr:uncharacterized protein LOC119189998 [Manduca sexta]
MLIMKELGKRGKMPDYVAIKYILQGIPDLEINKIMLYGVTTYAELKEKLKLYETFKKNSAKDNIRNNTFTSHSQNNPRRNTAATDLRCFSCGEKNHVSENCPHKLQGRKCFRCNEFGHIASDENCPTKKMAVSKTNYKKSSHISSGDNRQTSEQIGRRESTQVGTTERRAPANQISKQAFFNLLQDGENNPSDVQGEVYVATTDVKRCACTSSNCSCYEIANMTTRDGAVIGCNDKMADKCNNSDVCNVNKQNSESRCRVKPIKTVYLCSETANALIDSGCDVNLMSVDLYRKIKTIQCDTNSNITLVGLGYSKVNTYGCVTLDIIIDNCNYESVRFYIMPNDSVPFHIVLGNDFLQNITLVMKDGNVWLFPKNDRMNPSCEWLQNMSCFLTFPDCVNHALDPKIKEEVSKLVQSYVPQQIKEVPIELKIVLKDDLPVSQRARRLSFKEQEYVDCQVQDWLEDGIIRRMSTKP